MAAGNNSNLTNVAANYIKALKVPVTITSFRQQLIENPFFPSLYSLSNTFERLNIAHEAYEINKENFEQLIPPYIAYLKNQPTGKDFVLVTSATQSELHFIADGKKEKKVTKEKFLSDWENIVLKAEPGTNSVEKDYRVNRKKEITASNKVVALIAASALFFCSIIYFFLHALPANLVIIASVLLFTKLLGLAVTTLLLIYEIDTSNAFVKSICTAGRQTNCNAVLQSKASKILGMSWSEVGFFYFAATLLFLLFPAINFNAKIFILCAAACLVSPYILFSIYYQWKVIKQWCRLCLMTQGILIIELTWCIINWRLKQFSISDFKPSILPIFYSVLLPIILWYVLKPLLLKAKDEFVYKVAYRRLLYNPDTFTSLLQQQPVAPDGYQNIGIEMGNPNAANTIIKVCNPYCGSCAKSHAILDEILHNDRNVKMKLIFTASNSENDIRGIVAKHLLAIAEKGNEQLILQSLNDWYLQDKKDYEIFAKKYPMNGELKLQEKQIDKMSAWCKEAVITATPTLFLNGYKLPENYKIEELKYIL